MAATSPKERARNRRKIALRSLQQDANSVDERIILLTPKTVVAREMLETMRSNPMNTMFMAV